MKVNSGQDFLYLLHEDYTLKSLRLIEDPEELLLNGNIQPVLFQPEILCQTIDVSVIGVLWCVKPDGRLFYFDAFKKQWMIVPVSEKTQLELAKAKMINVALNAIEWINKDDHRLRKMDRLNGKCVRIEVCNI